MSIGIEIERAGVRPRSFLFAGNGSENVASGDRGCLVRLLPSSTICHPAGMTAAYKPSLDDILVDLDQEH